MELESKDGNCEGRSNQDGMWPESVRDEVTDEESQVSEDQERDFLIQFKITLLPDEFVHIPSQSCQYNLLLIPAL